MRTLVKLLANKAALICTSPLMVLYYLSVAVLGKGKAFPGYSQLVSMIPGLLGIYVRRAFYSGILEKCDADVCISFNTVFSHPGITIGKTTYIGVGCMVGDVELQPDVLIGSHVSIINGNRQHGIERLDIPVREQPGEYPRLIIGEDSWIGDRAVVMANVGKHCVIGAGSVVTKPLSDYSIAVGNPARVIGSRQGQEDDLEVNKLVVQSDLTPEITENSLQDKT